VGIQIPLKRYPTLKAKCMGMYIFNNAELKGVVELPHLHTTVGLDGDPRSEEQNGLSSTLTNVRITENDSGEREIYGIAPAT
jgi:hypothetical protein